MEVEEHSIEFGVALTGVEGDSSFDRGEVDELTRWLRRELEGLEAVVSVEPVPAEAPGNARNPLVFEAGRLIVTAAQDAGAILGVVAAIQSWLARLGSTRTSSPAAEVEARRGAGVSAIHGGPR